MDFDLPFQTAALAVAGVAALGVTRSWWRSPYAIAACCGSTFLIALATCEGVFHLMRLCSWIAFVHLPLLLLAAALHARRNRVGSVAALACALVLIAIAVDAFFVEPKDLETTTSSLASPRVKHPLRIVILADIQTDRVGAYERSVFDRVAQLDPDLVLLPGDFVQVYDDTRPEQIGRLRDLFRLLSPPLGAWAVRGNIDPPDSHAMFAGTSVRYLERTSTVQIGNDISLTGLSMVDSFDSGLSLSPGGAGLRIIMGHAPDFALGSVHGDLLVAGHTHGGQVQLPVLGPLITLSRAPRSWAKGGAIALDESRTLVVSRGIGMERGRAPRLRFLCRPQLVVLDIAPRRPPQ